MLQAYAWKILSHQSPLFPSKPAHPPFPHSLCSPPRFQVLHSLYPALMGPAAGDAEIDGHDKGDSFDFRPGPLKK
ncbi:unnamed protein product, partial [Vitis vinifera]|uniref:Uncharacterized protein n=1 Tax=Vitis vinifera TaxID=29760 RepID=D7SKK5_VITVI